MICIDLFIADPAGNEHQANTVEKPEQADGRIQEFLLQVEEYVHVLPTTLPLALVMQMHCSSWRTAWHGNIQH